MINLQGLVPLVGSNDESWCQGLDGLASRSAAYYQQGARFAKWYKSLLRLLSTMMHTHAPCTIHSDLLLLSLTMTGARL